MSRRTLIQFESGELEKINPRGGSFELFQTSSFWTSSEEFSRLTLAKFMTDNGKSCEPNNSKSAIVSKFLANAVAKN